MIAIQQKLWSELHCIQNENFGHKIVYKSNLHLYGLTYEFCGRFSIIYL